MSLEEVGAIARRIETAGPERPDLRVAAAEMGRARQGEREGGKVDFAFDPADCPGRRSAGACLRHGHRVRRREDSRLQPSALSRLQAGRSLRTIRAAGRSRPHLFHQRRDRERVGLQHRLPRRAGRFLRRRWKRRWRPIRCRLPPAPAGRHRQCLVDRRAADRRRDRRAGPARRPHPSQGPRPSAKRTVPAGRRRRAVGHGTHAAADRGDQGLAARSRKSTPASRRTARRTAATRRRAPSPPCAGSPPRSASRSSKPLPKPA